MENIFKNFPKESILSMFFFFFLIVCFGAFLFSPLFLFLLTFSGLLIFSSFLHIRLLRFFIIIISFISFLIIVGSRNYYDELNYDLSIYYGVYKSLQFDFYNNVFLFGGGVEIGWPIVYWIFGGFFDLSPIQLALFNTIISLSIIILWVELKVKPLVNRNELGILYFCLFIFMNLSILGFLQRQALTIGLLLFSLTTKSNKRFLFLIFLATLFHLSSCLVAFFIYLSKNINFTKKKIIILFLSVVLFRMFFSLVIFKLLSFFTVFDSIVHKLSFFDNIGFQISTLRYVILFFFLFLIVFVYNKVDKNFKELYNYAVFSSVFIVAFVGIPLFADRIFMIGMLVYGIFYFLFFYRRYKLFALFFAVLYFFIFILEKTNTVGSLSLGDEYWARYDYIGETIFYYLSKI